MLRIAVSRCQSKGLRIRDRALPACGARKANCFEAPAARMYIGSYHRRPPRRRALSTSARVMLVSARYVLVTGNLALGKAHGPPGRGTR